eukprot:gnl/MRDRNA2_/MRDRNA2_83977_c0_seq4.p1 gnl/MRDRNA2_/MRDRNA2_83977_c0~~gnl/MRDRNA2_/MRDRNA2_83977_c0_seq4.p1  ORF type:complete len:517 (+),score=105.00 gnl/MRDRNA2_/MRDRNA2_83977_c0_seq4:98-1552(+)
MAKMIGVVKKSFLEDGFGFISPEGNQNDVYFSMKDVEGMQVPDRGDSVHFIMGRNKRGSCAKKIEVEGQKWFAAVMDQDTAKLCSMVQEGQDVNAMCGTQKCQECDGTGDGDLDDYDDDEVCGQCGGLGFDTSKPTAVLLAVQNDKLRSLQTLIDLCADVNKADVNKQNPLCEAVSRRSKQMVSMLLIAGAEPNARGEHDPPLFIAAQRNEALIVEMLLEAGADPNARGSEVFEQDVEWITAEDVARRNRHDETVCVIKGWREPHLLQLQILSQASGSMELELLSLGGTKVARFLVPLQEAPANIFEMIASTAEIEKYKIKLFLNDDPTQYTHCKAVHFTGTTEQFLARAQALQASTLVQDVSAKATTEVAITDQYQPYNQPALLSATLVSAKAAVNLAITGQNQGAMVSSWTAPLSMSLCPLAEGDATLRNILLPFGWTGTQFSSLPDLHNLLSALEAAPVNGHIESASSSSATTEDDLVERD